MPCGLSSSASEKKLQLIKEILGFAKQILSNDHAPLTIYLSPEKVNFRIGVSLVSIWLWHGLWTCGSISPRALRQDSTSQSPHKLSSIPSSLSWPIVHNSGSFHSPYQIILSTSSAEIFRLQHVGLHCIGLRDHEWLPCRRL